jgi:hypothetical protein
MALTACLFVNSEVSSVVMAEWVFVTDRGLRNKFIFVQYFWERYVS